MSVQKTSTKNESQQPIGRLCGLMAGCVCVALGGWMEMRPETIVTRGLAISVVTAVAVRIVVVVYTTCFQENDD